MAQLISRLTATIAIAQANSDALTINGGKVAVIEMPAAWTTAVITFLTSMDGTNYFPAYDEEGVEIYLIANTATRIYINIAALSQQKYIKLRSGTILNPVAQAAARTIYVEVWNS